MSPQIPAHLYDPEGLVDGYKAPEPIEIDPGESKQAGGYVLKNTGSQKVYVATGHSIPEPSVDEELREQYGKEIDLIIANAEQAAIDDKGMYAEMDNNPMNRQTLARDIMHLLTNRIEAAKQEHLAHLQIQTIDQVDDGLLTILNDVFMEGGAAYREKGLLAKWRFWADQEDWRVSMVKAANAIEQLMRNRSNQSTNKQESK